MRGWRLVGGPSGTVTLLFTDIEGSTRLWEASAGEMRVALERHVALIRLGDRIGYFNMLDQAAYALALAAARCGEPRLACQLVGYADAHLAAHRILNPMQAWLQRTLADALAPLESAEQSVARQEGERLDRRGFMRLLARVEQSTSSRRGSMSEPTDESAAPG